MSRYQKGKTNLDFTEARDSERQWHPLGHMQVCTSLQTDNHASTPPLSLLRAGCPSCHPTNSVKFRTIHFTIILRECVTILPSTHKALTKLQKERWNEHQRTLSGSSSSVIWPVIITALSREYTKPSTKSLCLSFAAQANALTTSASCLTGWYSSRTYFFAGTMRISAATRNPTVPCDHGTA